jgi:hypothetical protein
MTNKNFNAKKVLMSTVAAVVFSFVFTTSANANTNAGTPQKSFLEIRVKDAPKRNVGIRVKGAQKGNVEVRVKGAQKGNVEIRVKDAPNNSFENFLDQVLGIRVKVRV